MTAANHLIHEKSPYLLQHAHNPVDWHPWSPEAFAKAQAENKPIFLSIGYATCHWCHVMERETFEDDQAARELNQTFICIKVDREERPDVDTLYMTACQMITGSGGWPLTIFMTPDKKPFFAATYLPKQSRYGRPGIMELCRQVRSLWSNNPSNVFSTAQEITQQMKRIYEFSTAKDILDETVLDTAAKELSQSFDQDHGGFGTAPKFPTPHRLQFLLQQYHVTQDNTLLDMVTKTLTAMRHGGLWDHVGFGFHRYSTDSKWLLPHFEKMLYDQALLAMTYLEAYQITQTPFFAQTAHEILTYVKREMTSSSGGFYAAQDADSEGEEGKFYTWRYDQWQEVLGAKRAADWQEVMNIFPNGNFNDEASGQPSYTNIIHLSSSTDYWAHKWNISTEQFSREFEEIRNTLFTARTKRIAPLTDDKILTDWNGLMIAAFAMGARILKEPAYETTALKAADFIWDALRSQKGALQHRFRDGQAAIIANANDFAYYIWALLELYRTDFQLTHLERALTLQEQMTEEFWNENSGGFYITSAHEIDLPMRPIELYDGALPSANSVALCNLIRLARLTGTTRWEEMAHKMIQTFGATVKSQPTAYTHFLTGVGYAQGRSCEVVLVGAPDQKETQTLVAELNKQYTPGLAIVLKTAENQIQLNDIIKYTQGVSTETNTPTAYICKGTNCSQPTTDIVKMIDLIKQETNS